MTGQPYPDSPLQVEPMLHRPRPPRSVKRKVGSPCEHRIGATLAGLCGTLLFIETEVGAQTPPNDTPVLLAPSPSRRGGARNA